MPFLTAEISGEGALVDIYVALSTPRIDALKAAGLTYPPPERARAIIDTGANLSSISPRIVRALGLVPSGIMPVHSATTGGASQDCNQYDVCFAFAEPSVKVLTVSAPAIEVQLNAPGVDVLFGRDMLDQCLFLYDGQGRTFTIAF